MNYDKLAYEKVIESHMQEWLVMMLPTVLQVTHSEQNVTQIHILNKKVWESPPTLPNVRYFHCRSR